MTEYMFSIAELEQQIAGHVALRDRWKRFTPGASDKMDAIFASIIAPLAEEVAARKSASAPTSGESGASDAEV